MQMSIFSIVVRATLVFILVVIAQQVGGGGAANPPLSAGSARALQILQQHRDQLESEQKNQLQHDLDISDDEMDAIWAKCEAVREAKFAINSDTIKELISRGNISPGRLLMYGLPQGFNPDFSNVSNALAELAKTERDPAASPDQLADKLDAARQLLQKEEADLESAQADLRKIVKLRQEAMLMVWGYLN